jgi:hypothetical protein
VPDISDLRSRHVAHAYEYLAGWMRRILAGEAVTVTELSALVAGCAPDQLAAGDGQVERLAQVAVRHADSHRVDIEASLI